MEKLIDIFCHAIRIHDPLSIKIAVGIGGGGLIFMIAVLIILGGFAAWEREITTPVSRKPPESAS
jgi:hypothetical protein